MRLTQTIERLNKSIAELESRFSPACRPIPPQPEAPANLIERGPKVIEAAAPIAESLNALEEQLVRAEARVQSLLHRAEI